MFHLESRLHFEKCANPHNTGRFSFSTAMSCTHHVHAYTLGTSTLLVDRYDTRARTRIERALF